MFKNLTPIVFSLFCLSAQAQFGTYDKANANEISTRSLTVLLDEGASPFNDALKAAVEKSWNMGEAEFSTVGELATAGFLPEKNYLLHTTFTDAKTFEMHQLSIVRGWKMKKNEKIELKNNAVSGVPNDQIVAWILFDPNDEAATLSALMDIYVKHLQDYISNVAAGRIMDKTSALRMYQQRNRFIRDGVLMIDAKDVDKTMPSKEELETYYKSELKIVNSDVLHQAIQNGTHSQLIADVVVTGEFKTKHCFKRIFNASTGDLMYLSDDAALYGKKEGFLLEDLKSIDRAR